MHPCQDKLYRFMCDQCWHSLTKAWAMQGCLGLRSFVSVSYLASYSPSLFCTSQQYCSWYQWGAPQKSLSYSWWPDQLYGRPHFIVDSAHHNRVIVGLWMLIIVLVPLSHGDPYLEALCHPPLLIFTRSLEKLTL